MITFPDSHHPSNDCPIQHLPGDLLYDIAYIVASASSGLKSSNVAVAAPDSIRVVPISHVCRYWRALTLASPHLWSFLHLTTNMRLSMLLVFLSRSRDTPLYVRMRGPESFWDPSGDLLPGAQLLAEGHMERIEYIYISHFFRNDMMRLFELFADKRAPSLRSVTALSHFCVDIPAFLGGGMPMLQRLQSVGVSIPWLPYQNMIELDLANQPTPAKGDILWTLRHSPAIEVFSLFMHGRPSASLISHTEADSAINLPLLQTLRLGSKRATEDVLELLPHLDFPSTTSVHLHLRERPQKAVDWGNICPSLCAVQARVLAGLLKIIALNGLYRVAFRSLDNIFSIEWQWSEWRWGPGVDQDVSSVQYTLDCVTLPSLRSLTIEAKQYYLTAEQWMEILQRIPTIRKLEIDFASEQTGSAFSKTPAIFDALGRRGPDGSTVCPRLTHLIVKRTTVMTEVEGTPWDTLARALQNRVLSGAAELECLDVETQESRNDGPPADWARPFVGSVQSINIHWRNNEWSAVHLPKPT